MTKQGLLAYDGSMEAEIGLVYTKGRHDSPDSGGSAQYKLRTGTSRVFCLSCEPQGADRTIKA